jgi:hypothetical protein
MILKELLEDWEDQDISAYYLACCLGFIDYDSSFARFRESKGIFWTGNSTSDFLYKTLEKMLEIGMLEFNDDNRYRWNKEFKPS